MTFKGNQAAQEALYSPTLDQESDSVVCDCGKTHLISDTKKPIRVLTFRRGAGSFFDEFQRFMTALKITEVLHMAQSESDGLICLTMVFR